MAQQTDPLASGLSTTEGKVSVGAAAAGILLAFLGALEPYFRTAADAAPGELWLRIAAVVAGAAMAIAGAFNLTKSRTLVKGGILELLQQGAVVAAPLVAGVVLKKYLDPNNPKAAAVQVDSAGGVTLKPAIPISPTASVPAPMTPGAATPPIVPPRP